MALSKVNPNFVNVSQVGGRRNLIINGSHRVAQRATAAVTVTTSAQYRTVDRWKTDIDGSQDMIFRMNNLLMLQLDLDILLK